MTAGGDDRYSGVIHSMFQTRRQSTFPLMCIEDPRAIKLQEKDGFNGPGISLQLHIC